MFLIYTTLYGLAQIGAAESLYYFVPRGSGTAGRSVGNALATLALMGAVCLVVLYLTRGTIAAWLDNADLAGYLPFIGVFLAFTLMTAAFEIVMVSRNEHLSAARTYAASDVVRTVLFILPALAIGTLRAVLVGAAAFAALRLGAMFTYLWREFGRELKLDAALWRNQLAYALPFALAVGIDVVQANFHQWAVASTVDAPTFAIYAVGCLQIPLVDVVCSSTANVMMVRMAEVAGQNERLPLTLWHDTTARLASLIFPLAAFFLLNAHAVIAFLFTTRYLASVPIFKVWCLMILPSVFAVDAVLRVYGQTRVLVVLNAVRLAVIAVLIGWSMSTFGLIGAVLVTLPRHKPGEGCGGREDRASDGCRSGRCVAVATARRCRGSRGHSRRARVVGHAIPVGAGSGRADVECRRVRDDVRSHLVPAPVLGAIRRPRDGGRGAVGPSERRSLTTRSDRVWHCRYRAVGRPTRARRRGARDVPGHGASRTGRGRGVSRRTAWASACAG